MRIYATSDLHVDFNENMQWVKGLSSSDYVDGILIVAGDLSDNTEDIKRSLYILRGKFQHVFFVPGNHDLWTVRDRSLNSLSKFLRILKICRELNIETEPRLLSDKSTVSSLWIVPLFSWYVKPEEGMDTLYVPKEGEDSSLRMWGDNRFVVWPNSVGSPSDYFLSINEFDTRFRRIDCFKTKPLLSDENREPC